MCSRRWSRRSPTTNRSTSMPPCALAKWLVDQGNEGLVVAGTTGESATLSIDEKLTLFEAVAGAVTVPVIAGTTGSNTRQDIGLTAEAEKLGVAGILAVVPVLQPSVAGRARRPLPGDRGQHRPPGPAVRHPEAHRSQDRHGDADLTRQRRLEHRRRQGRCGRPRPDGVRRRCDARRLRGVLR